MSVILYPCFYVLLCKWIYLSCVLANNSQYVWVYFLFWCLMLWRCLVWVEVLCWRDRVWYSKEYACDPSMYLSVPSIGFLYAFVCRKLSPHFLISHIFHYFHSGSVLKRCRAEGIWCDAAFRMMVHRDLVSFLTVGWKRSFAQLVLYRSLSQGSCSPLWCLSYLSSFSTTPSGVY